MIIRQKPSEQIMRQIWAVMEQHDISQREIAAEMSVTEARISQIFGDRGNITLCTLDKLHEALINILCRRAPALTVILPEVA